MVVAVFAALVLVFCFIPIVVVTYLFAPRVTRDPAEVQLVAEKIGAIRIPADFVGVLAQSADNSGLEIQVARFDHRDARGRIVIGLAHFKSKSDALEQLGVTESKYLDQTIDNLFPGFKTIEEDDARELSFQVGSEQVAYNIRVGEEMESTTRLKQVAKTFATPRGTITIAIQAEPDYLSDEAIEILMKSLADPPVPGETVIPPQDR